MFWFLVLLTPPTRRGCEVATATAGRALVAKIRCDRAATDVMLGLCGDRFRLVVSFVRRGGKMMGIVKTPD
jgi:hypothetical protein